MNANETDTFWKSILWQQLGAAIDTLEAAIQACPDEVWGDSSRQPEWVSRDVVGFWYLAYHALFFLDFYLSDSAEGFTPPEPFNRDELDPAGLLPERLYTKGELQAYLEHCREKCRAVIGGLSDQTARQRCAFERLDLSVAELLLFNMRHVQHHAAQLNLILRQRTGSAPKWVTRTKTDLGK